MVLNPQANAVLEHIHQDTYSCHHLHFKLNMANTLTKEDIQDFLVNTSKVIQTTHHAMLNSYSGQTMFWKGSAI